MLFITLIYKYSFLHNIEQLPPPEIDNRDGDINTHDNGMILSLDINTTWRKITQSGNGVVKIGEVKGKILKN